jgi:putative two-component system response regulator
MKTIADAKILIIDDEEDRIALMAELLSIKGFTNVLGETDSAQAWEAFELFQPDLVILDLHMSPFNGFDVLRHIQPLKKEDEYLPILILTGDSTREVRERALSEGAMDFLAKPFNTTEILLRVHNLLHTRLLHLELASERASLERRVKERTAELERARNEMLDRLAMVAEYRDDNTGQHIRRVGTVAKAIALQLGMPEDTAELIGKAALLHDLGKVAISDQILLKPDKLTPEEFLIIKEHTSIGARLLSGSDSELLQMAEHIALAHHERWDGKGYMGWEGERTPVESRIVAVADVFDALVSKRPYKRAWTVEEALTEIKLHAGTQFDPSVVEAFLIAANADPVKELYAAMEVEAVIAA